MEENLDKVGYFLNYVKTLGDTSVLTPEKESAKKYSSFLKIEINSYFLDYK